MSLVQRIETLKYAGFVGLADSYEWRRDVRKAAVMWERAAEAGRNINYGYWAERRAKTCRLKIREPKNDD
ncbi:hypothetical protein SODG_004159 [Sodalis praecaptivus]